MYEGTSTNLGKKSYNSKTTKNSETYFIVLEILNNVNLNRLKKFVK